MRHNVYYIVYDEDYDIEAIFKTKEEAVKYVNRLNFVRYEDNRDNYVEDGYYRIEEVEFNLTDDKIPDEEIVDIHFSLSDDYKIKGVDSFKSYSVYRYICSSEKEPVVHTFCKYGMRSTVHFVLTSKGFTSFEEFKKYAIQEAKKLYYACR